MKKFNLKKLNIVSAIFIWILAFYILVSSLAGFFTSVISSVVLVSIAVLLATVELVKFYSRDQESGSGKSD